jgi:AraC-like DNA-binding protein
MANSGGEANSPQFLFLREFIRVFNSHMDDSEYSVEDLADEFNMSRAQFFRKIKAVFGTSPYQLVRLARVKRAASLLRSGDLNVTQVMYQVGMKSPSYFASLFKKYYGVNPSGLKTNLLHPAT